MAHRNSPQLPLESRDTKEAAIKLDDKDVK